MPEKDEFLQKREERQKKLRKKRAKTIFFLFIILCIVVGAVLSVTVLFPIKSISATGSIFYEEKEIVKASGLIGNNLFAINKEKVEQKIRKALPYVDKIELKRKLPDTLQIKAYDAEDYAYYISGGKFYTVSEKGFVLSEEAEEPMGIIKIVCSDAECKIGEKVIINNKTQEENINSLITSLKAKEIEITSIDVSNSVALSVRVLDRFDVNFGTSADLDKKISHLKGMIKSIGEGRNGSIDLSMWTPQKSEGSFTPKEN